jgi:hypothetical protein
MKKKLVITDKKILESLTGPRSVIWEPKAFVLENPKLKSRIIEEEVLQQGLSSFLEDPTAPQIYIVAGNPDDAEALTFASYLAQEHKKVLRFPNPVVAPVLGNFDPVVKPDTRPTMLVLYNLTPISSNLKYEKVRDAIASHPKIPIVIVVAGEDPISFAARLHIPCHGLMYFAAKTYTAIQEVI